MHPGKRRRAQNEEDLDMASLPCPACDRGQKKKCTCEKKRSYTPRGSKAAVAILHDSSGRTGDSESEKERQGLKAAANHPGQSTLIFNASGSLQTVPASSRAPPPSSIQAPSEVPVAGSAEGAIENGATTEAEVGAPGPAATAVAVIAASPKTEWKRGLLVAKDKKNRSRRIPTYVISRFLDFHYEVYQSNRGCNQPSASNGILPEKTLSPPCVSRQSVAAGLFPDPCLYEVGGGGVPVKLVIVDWRAVGCDIKCPQCGSEEISVEGSTIELRDTIGIKTVVTKGSRPIFTAAAIGTCAVPSCRARFRHDDAVVLRQLSHAHQDAALLYPVDVEQVSSSNVLFRPDRNLVAQLRSLSLSSSSGMATLLADLNRSAAQQRSLSHVAYSSALVRAKNIAEKIAGDEIWAAAGDEGRKPLQATRNLLDGIRGQSASLPRFDDSAAASGYIPVDADTASRWVEKSRAVDLDFYRRECQSIVVSKEDVISLDECVPIGKKNQLSEDGSGKGKSVPGKGSMIVCAGHQVIATTILESRKYDEVGPMLEEGSAKGGWKSRVAAVDDLGAAASWHGSGTKLIASLPSVEHVVQDHLHESNRLSRTHQVFHNAHRRGSEKIKDIYSFIPASEFDRFKLIASTPAGTCGGFKVGGKLLIQLNPRKHVDISEGYTMQQDEFNRLYWCACDGKPSKLFEEAFAGTIDRSGQEPTTIKVKLGETFRWSAGAVIGHCGRCSNCGHLGDGWLQARDGASGRLYYYKKAAVQWEEPNGPGWTKAIEEKSKEAYYYQNGAAQWERPKAQPGECRGKEGGE